MSVYYIGTEGGEYISHHGILGQKWGIRRYQNADGTLTPEGIKRYQKFDSKSYKAEKRQQYEDEGMKRGQAKKLAKASTKLVKKSDKEMYKAQKKQQKLEGKIDKERENLRAKNAKLAGKNLSGEKYDKLERRNDERSWKKQDKLMNKWKNQQGKMRTHEYLNEHADEYASAYVDLEKRVKGATWIGWFIGGLPGGIIGGVVGRSRHETNAGDNSFDSITRKAKPKAETVRNDLENRRKNYIDKVNRNDNTLSTQKATIDKEVARARKTGTYDMEFLEKELDVDERTGELLKGKALDDAYRKYLNSK